MSFSNKSFLSIPAFLFLTACGGGGGSTPLELSVASFAEFQLIENQTGSWSIDASSNKTDPISYSLSGGPDSSFFSLSGNTLSFAGTANYEAPDDTNKDSVYEVSVTVSSQSVSKTQAIYVRVADTPEAPVISTASIDNVKENITSVATISASDEDVGSVLTYSLLDSGGAKDEKLLSINESGVLTFISAPNYESPSDFNSDNTVEFTVVVSDGSLTAQADYSFKIIDVNESPFISTTEISDIAEGVSSIATISASDPDAGASLTYSLVDSNGAKDEGLLSIDSSTGVVAFISAPNFETPTDVGADNKIEFSVLVSDGSLEVSQDYSFSITNVNEAPTISTSSFSIAEGSTAIGTIAASDPDASSTLSYTISGTDSSKFSINASSGAVAFLSPPNFESPTDNGLDNTYNFTVTVSDGSLSSSQSIAVAVGNVNEAPTISTSSFSIAEGSTAIGTIAASDPDASSTLSYTISGTDSSKFSINASSGAVAFLSPPNFESPTDNGLDNTYNFTVTVSDGSLSSSQSIAVAVGNVNEAPSFSIASAQSYVENSGATISVAANDPDASSSLTYTLSGTDASKFTISSSGVLSFSSAPDYEAPSDSGSNNIFNVSVAVSDGVNSSSVALVISLTDDTSDNFGIRLPAQVALAELKKES
ncbi:cadherin repeat domain-containing protein [Gammaproteobacteria bacterium]|nr:cadherin repeat domain-containing protein [Gammaproteobacteria bacterium]